MIVYVAMTFFSVGFALILQQTLLSGRDVLTIQLPQHLLRFNRRFLLALLSFLPVLLVTGLRDHIGTDYQSYIDIANEITERGITYRAEYGYILFNKLVLSIWSNPLAVLFATCLISYGLVFWTILDLSPAIPFSLFYFITASLLQPSLNMVRQFIAVAITFYGLRWILVKPSGLKYLLTIGVATLFHQTAIFMLPFWLLCRFRYKKRHYLAMIAALLVAFVFRQEVLAIVLKIFYPGYADSRYVERIQINELQIVTSLLLVLLVFRYKPILLRQQSGIRMVNLIYFRAMVATLLAWVPLLWRLLLYLDITALVLIPIVVRCEPNRKLRRFYYLLFLTIAVLYAWYSVRFQNSHDVYPYRSIFSVVN